MVEELARRFMAGDATGAFALLHPDIRVEQPASFPHGGWHERHDGVIQMGTTFGQYWEREIRDPRIYQCEDLVLQVTTQTWKARSTGRSATVEVVELLRVDNGQITEIRVFQQDSAALLETLSET